MRVAVVGAGFAGLAAANELSASGADVQVFEARDRVGGRVWSESLLTPSAQSVVVERGAEFVLEGYDLLRRYASECGLSLVDTGMSYYLREPRGGGDIDIEAMIVAGSKLSEVLPTAGRRSITDILDGLEFATDLTDAIRCRIEISCACEADLLDSQVLEHVASFSSLPSHRLAGGNQKLAFALAARLGDRLHLNSPVRAIVSQHGFVEIRTDTDIMRVDRVVLALPLPLLCGLLLSPGLPGWKLDALARCAYGHAAKLHIPLTHPVHTSAVMSVPDRYWSWTATDETGLMPAVLNCFAGSPAALRRLGLERGPAGWIAKVQQTQPNMPLFTEGALLTTWTDDPWALGAYSAHGTQSTEGDFDALRRPIGSLYFAGEYLGGDFAGLMEGALRSGRQAAADILGDNLSVQPTEA
jgi:monoamine oxidase